MMLKLLATTAVLLFLTTQCVDSAVTALTEIIGDTDVILKQLTDVGIGPEPTTPCTDKNDGSVEIVSKEFIWLCKSGQWMPYQLIKIQKSCQEVTGASGAYHISVTDPCTGESSTMKVYCNMDDDNGGWTLVWKHSAMEVPKPLTDDMKYFSDFYKECIDLEAGWCNIPNKARFNVTEMMIAAYHEKELVFAWKGIFNWNIDKDWTGGFLLNYTKVEDKCTLSKTLPPMPNTYSKANNILGLIFAKRGTYMNYQQSYCDDYYGSLTAPLDCRWWDCRLPTTISKTYQYTQRTTAIYVR